MIAGIRLYVLESIQAKPTEETRKSQKRRFILTAIPISISSVFKLMALIPSVLQTDFWILINLWLCSLGMLSVHVEPSALVWLFEVVTFIVSSSHSSVYSATSAKAHYHTFTGNTDRVFKCTVNIKLLTFTLTHSEIRCSKSERQN